MLKKISGSVILLAAMLLPGAKSFAQSGEYVSYTPYSIFGIGNLEQQGSPYNIGMGGVGIASRNNRYLNLLNPAAITARDTLSVMMDFSVKNNNTIFSQNSATGRLNTANNSTNIGSMAFAFPIWRSLTSAVGITPYSSGGYSYRTKETDPEIIGRIGNISYYDYGQGSFYKLFAAVAGNPVKNLAIGAEGGFIFGNYDKYFTQVFTKTGVNSAQDSYKLHLNSWTAKFGAQYERPVGKKTKLGIGVTYALGTRLNGTMIYTHQSAGSAETVDITPADTTFLGSLSASKSVRLGSELGLGISLNRDEKLRLELDCLLSDWRGTRIDKTPGFAISDSDNSFTAGLCGSLRAGVEYTPDRYSIRSRIKRASYRVGTYYNNEYYKVAGNEINSFGITFGTTIPVYVKGLMNGVTIGADLGQRGSLSGGLVRERYFRLSVGVNLHDVWFIKPRYE